MHIPVSRVISAIISYHIYLLLNKMKFSEHKYGGLEILCPMDRTAGLSLQLPPNTNTCLHLSMVQEGLEYPWVLWKGRWSQLVGGKCKTWSYLEGALGKWGMSEGCFERKKLWKCLLRVCPDYYFLGMTWVIPRPWWARKYLPMVGLIGSRITKDVLRCSLRCEAFRSHLLPDGDRNTFPYSIHQVLLPPSI